MSWGITVAIAAGTVAFFAPLWPDMIRGWIALVSADRVYRGEVPYRDFWTMYAPGHFYLLATLFALFGKQVLVSAVAGSVACGVTAAGLWRLGIAVTGRLLPGLALVALTVAALLNTGFFRYLGSYPPALAGIAWALTLFALHLRSGRLAPLLGAGAAAGVAAVFKHDVGAYAFLAMSAGLVLHAALVEPPPGGRVRGALRRLGALALPAGLPVLATIALLAPVAGREMFEQLIVFPATDFPLTRGERYPPLLPLRVLAAGLSGGGLQRLGGYLTFALPFFVAVASGVAVLAAGPRRFPRHTALGATLAIAYALHWSAAHVQINTNIVSMTVYAAALGIVGLDAWREQRPRTRVALRTGAAAVLSVWLLAVGGGPLRSMWWRLGTFEKMVELDMSTTAGVLVWPTDVERFGRLEQLVEQHVPPGEAIFVGERRHDIVIMSNTHLYFVLNRPVVGRYHELHPGIADTAPVQQEIIAELERRQTPLIILGKMFENEGLDRVLEAHLRKGLAIGATDLDEYIAAHYEFAERVGPFKVFLRRTRSEAQAG